MTNDLTEAIDTTDLTDAHEAGTGSQPSRHGHRRGGRLAVAVAAGLVALGVGAAIGLSSGSDDTTTRSTSAALEATAPLTATTAPSSDPAAPTGEQGDGTDPDPAPPADPGHLVVDTVYHGLETNDFDGSFEIANDGGSDLAWTWKGHPMIALSPSSGVLAPGESVVVHFTVTWQQLKNGAFILVSSVDTDDQSVDVTIAGTRDIEVNPGITLPKPVLTD